MSLTISQSRKLIWLIEYPSESLWLLQLLPENWGHEVVRFNYVEALAFEIHCQIVKPQLVILSIAPSVKNSLEIIQGFRRDSVLFDIPLICFCIAYGISKFQVLAAGANDVLDQPFEFEELYFKLQRLLEPKISDQQSEITPPYNDGHMRQSTCVGLVSRLEQSAEPEGQTESPLRSDRWSKSTGGMTTLVSKTPSTSLVQQQQYWSKVVQKPPQLSVWEMLTEAGYKVKAPGNR